MYRDHRGTQKQICRDALLRRSEHRGDSRSPGSIRYHRESRLAIGTHMADARDEGPGGMNPQADWEEIERLFNEAIDLPVNERQALLASASAPVRAEVESLLKTDDEAFFAAPPVHLAADLLERQPSALSAGHHI